LGYIVSSFACRFALGYQFSSISTRPDDEVLEAKGNGIFFGIQLQK